MYAKAFSGKTQLVVLITLGGMRQGGESKIGQKFISYLIHLYALPYIRFPPPNHHANNDFKMPVRM